MQNAMNLAQEHTRIHSDKDPLLSESSARRDSDTVLSVSADDDVASLSDRVEPSAASSGRVLVQNTRKQPSKSTTQAQTRRPSTTPNAHTSSAGGIKSTMDSLFKTVLESKDTEITRLEAICVKLRNQCNINKQVIDRLRTEHELALKEQTRLSTIIDHQACSLKTKEDDSRQKHVRNPCFLTTIQYRICTMEQTTKTVDPQIYELNLRMEQLGEQLLSVTRERDMYKSEMDKIRTGSSRKRGAPDPQLTLTGEQVAAIDAQWARKLNTLKSKHEKIVSEYQTTIRKLAQKESPIPVPVEKPDVSKVLKKRIEELENRIESVKTFYALKLKRQQASVKISPEINDDVCSVRKPTRIVERLPTVYIKSVFTGIEGSGPSNPPMEEDSASPTLQIHEWFDLLRGITAVCDPEVLRRLLFNDLEVTSINQDEFRLRVGSFIDSRTVDTICSVYRLNDTIDVKLFLSDVFARCGDNVIDLEGRVSTLRRHINSLMYELKDKIECIESGNAIADRGFTSPRGTSSMFTQHFKQSLQYGPNSLIRE
jgi:hypothetical protein